MTTPTPATHPACRQCEKHPAEFADGLCLGCATGLGGMPGRRLDLEDAVRVDLILRGSAGEYRRWAHEVVRLLAFMRDSEGFRQLGYDSIEAYAEGIYEPHPLDPHGGER